MTVLTIDQFRRAIADIVEHGDNDVLPFDVDTRFIAERAEELANLAFNLGSILEKRHVHHLHAGHLLEELGGEVRRGAAAAGAVVERAGLFLRELDELGDGFHRH
jgi:hypothetical protein